VFVQRVDPNAPLSSRFGWLEARHGRPLLAILGLLTVQIGFLLGLMTFYTWFRKTYFQQPPADAFANAHDVIDLQSRLGLSVHRVELPLQRWAIDTGVIDFFNMYYRQFKPMLYIAAALCFLLAPVAYRHIRRIFLITTAIAFPMYALYPLAPPRLMTEYGYQFVDSVAIAKGISSTAAGTGSANLYAAMPSMHIGWTAIAALWIAAALPWRRIGVVIGALHLTIMAATVMITGNHYWLDIAGGLAVVGIAILIERLLPAHITLPRPRSERLPRPMSKRTA
jgi:hypothetical protein